MRSLAVEGDNRQSDNLVLRLRALAIRVDGTDGRLGLKGLAAAVSLGGRGADGRGRDGVERVGLLARNTKSKGDDGGDVGVGAVDLDGDAERLAEKAHGLETLLVVGATTADEDPDLVVDEGALVLLEGADDTLEGGSDVGEVGDTTTDDEELAVGARSPASDEVD